MALPHLRLPLLATLTVMLVAIACGGDAPLEPGGGTFSVGQASFVESGRDMRVLAGATDGEFIGVVANISPDSSARSSYTLRGAGLGGAPTGGSNVRLPAGGAGPLASRAPASSLVPLRDAAFEDGLRERERVELTPRFAAARSWNAARVPALPTSLNVGDLVRLNVNAVDACANPVMRWVRVVAVGTKALVLADTLNPRNGFTTADFQRYAARFDTLVYPMDVAAFGEPTDIDHNGKIAIVFTRAVNELTQRNSFSYVGGLTFSRDLFPQVTTSRATGCPSSNEGEIFYLMTPDPTGSINGNRRTTGFVDTNTTAVIAHEFVHLINASRKLYINTSAPKFEEKWLDEGLAHVAEELLFYRESGLSPRENIRFGQIVNVPRVKTAFITDMGGNSSRYRDFIAATAGSSPYAAGDSVTTRGATWSLLRYLTDRAAASDGDIWSRLVNSTAVGMENLQAVYGRELPPMIRDWMTSLAVDDAGATSAELQQKSWNWRSIIAGEVAAPGFYPLTVTPMTTATSYSGTVVAGGSAFYRLSVPANGSATISLGGQSGAAGSNLQLVIVRIK